MSAPVAMFSSSALATTAPATAPPAARWVSAEQWHPDQSFEWLPGGRYRLRVPYARSEELVADLMRHGAAVEVLGPPALRAAVARALKGAAQIYET